jgi:hypothetical protein
MGLPSSLKHSSVKTTAAADLEGDDADVKKPESAKANWRLT